MCGTKRSFLSITLYVTGDGGDGDGDGDDWLALETNENWRSVKTKLESVTPRVTLSEWLDLMQTMQLTQHCLFTRQSNREYVFPAFSRRNSPES